MINKRSGFTLIELLVVFLIFAFFMSSLFLILGTELRVWQKIALKTTHNQTKNFVLARLTQDIRSSQKILPGSNSSKLILQNKTIIIEYKNEKGCIKRKKNNYSSSLTDKGEIADMSFKYLSTNLVEVLLDGTTTKVSLRNNQ